MLLLFCAWGYSATAQQKSKIQVVQLTGVVYSADSINEKIPFVNIKIKGTTRGTVTDLNGFFSIPILASDTLVFSAVGYAEQDFFLKDPSINLVKLFVNIRMHTQTYTLKGVTVYGLTKENFKRAFLELDIPQNAYAYTINPKLIPTPEELKLPPPVGINFSPSELLKEIPAIKRASDKKKHKKMIEKDGDQIPEMH
ncbi:carboxypeptidase-like regulatory domain-containing protein [Solitalea koreensis]|nr:carboxypeptidase-like regulatory domain-containing protein [Solitalea koreensis]